MHVNDLEIAEIPYPTGVVKHRYSRYLATDGSRWVRHGLFRSYHEDGTLASEGSYEHGLETGLWRDFFPSGQLAAEGYYVAGQEADGWRFWKESGAEVPPPSA